MKVKIGSAEVNFVSALDAERSLVFTELGEVTINQPVLRISMSDVLFEQLKEQQNLPLQEGLQQIVLHLDVVKGLE